jgi:uncharacterized protein
MLYKFRAHHLICNLCFQGKGYSEKFVANFNAINSALTMNPDDKNIIVTQGSDDICAKCPRNVNDICKENMEVLALDKAYLEILRLEIGQIMSLNDVKIKAQKFVTLKKFHQVCAKCSWQTLCERFISSVVTFKKQI